jgi:hypothetical protein
MIYYAANRTLRYVKEENIGRVRAFNAFVSNLDNYFQHAIQEGWQIRISFRPKECPVSAIRFLVNRINARAIAKNLT